MRNNTIKANRILAANQVKHTEQSAWKQAGETERARAQFIKRSNAAKKAAATRAANRKAKEAATRKK